MEVRKLKVADRVLHVGEELLVSVVLSDRVFLRKPNSIVNCARLLFNTEFGSDNLVEVVR